MCLVSVVKATFMPRASGEEKEGKGRERGKVKRSPLYVYVGELSADQMISAVFSFV